MVGLIVYLTASLLVGGIVSAIIVMLRSTKKRGDSSPYTIIFICLLLSVFGPFLWVEALTYLFGKDMKPAIEAAYAESPLDGEFQYYRVMKYSDKEATAIAVIKEPQDWGGSDRPILEILLVKKSGKWEPKSYKIVTSERLNKDGFVTPPYR